MSYLYRGNIRYNNKSQVYYTSQKNYLLSKDKDLNKNNIVLYTSLAPSLCHATILIRDFLVLDKQIPICLLAPAKNKTGWYFKKNSQNISFDKYNKTNKLIDLYKLHDKKFTGHATLPILWNQESQEIISNDPLYIIRFITSYIKEEQPLIPKNHIKNINYINKKIINDLYVNIHLCAYSKNQKYYEKYCNKVFESLNELNNLLKNKPYILGSTISESDWILFSIILRFDLIFNPLFKCNLFKLEHFKYLYQYLHSLYKEPRIASSINIEQIKEHYYKSYLHLNLSKIIPLGNNISYLDDNNFNLY